MSDFQIVMTPVVPVTWAYIDKPDTAYDADGIYQADLHFDVNVPEQKEFLSVLKKAIPAGAANMPYKKDKDTGLYVVKVKQKAVVTVKGKTYTFKPKVFDASGRIIVNVPKIGNGSRVAMQIELRPYTMKGAGVRLNPLAMQIVELVEFKEEDSANNDACPFAKVDGFKQETFGDAPKPKADDIQEPPFDDGSFDDDGSNDVPSYKAVIDDGDF